MQHTLRAAIGNTDALQVSVNETHLLQAKSVTEHATVPLTLTYYPAHKFLEATWQRPVSSQEYRQAIRFVGLCLAILKAEYVLVDFSKMGAPTEEDENTTTLFLQKALGNTTIKRSARLLSTTPEQAHSYKIVIDQGPVLPYPVQCFHSVTEARLWLFQDFEEVPYHTGNALLIPLTCSLRALKSLVQPDSSPVTKTAPATEVTKKDAPVTRCTTNFVDICVDTEKSLITLNWLRKVSTREHRYGILKAGRMMMEKKIRFALLNQQRLGTLTLEEQAWLAKQSANIISRSSLERLAIVNSTDVIQQMASDKINLRIRESFTNYLSEYFLDEHDAMYWLLNPITDK